MSISTNVTLTTSVTCRKCKMQRNCIVDSKPLTYHNNNVFDWCALNHLIRVLISGAVAIISSDATHVEREYTFSD